MLKEVTLDDTQQLIAASLVKSLNQERADAEQRIFLAQKAVHDYATGIAKTLKIPMEKYVFHTGKLCFVDRESTKPKGNGKK